MIWDMVQQMPRRAAVPRPERHRLHALQHRRTPFGRMLDYLGISGVHTHSLRHQFGSEALDQAPRELANISQILGHDNVETTLHFYIHASANAEQRIVAMMNASRLSGFSCLPHAYP
jgi:integrase